MADLVVPALGESITEAVVSVWLKQVGDAVATDELVAELETDKVTVQLPSPVAGVLAAQAVPVGATVKVGDVIGSVQPGAAKAEAKPAAQARPAAAAPAPVAAAAPPVAAVPAVATPPVAAAPAAAPSAVATAPAARPAAAPSSAAPAQAVGSAAAPARSGNGDGLDKAALLKLTPSQRVAAREIGTIPHHGAPMAAPAAAAPAGPRAEERLAQVDPRDDVVAMSPLRRRVAERLVQAQHEAASLTTFNEVDMTAVMELRARYKDSFEKAHAVKLGFMSFFVKACIAACKAFPGLNAEVIGGHIVYKKHYDFGIAVSAPKGLVVPVLRDCDALSFAGVEKGILTLADRARSGKLSLPELSGGTFSLTNGGIYGSMMSTPLLNYPQTGILGMHNIVKRAVVVGDEVKIRPMMYVALSYDHRVVDGREAVSFLVAVKERLEAPDRMLLEV
ncbi:MAG TPA: 2-oxoglutarate dehydrogenase complex dihydrolipoyllysine-residue succinyltransferase [Kofleriaceae bacterium]|jgi:2-oxoglutarate dehydrogenase E2 component (dihydrolipoamide succinyltransferase)|nr:2-oxoglutarate dehydrogenase complex dihydrolipoyllysine-residue succinyltransferase [Kofleriaceae bacterium]